MQLQTPVGILKQEKQFTYGSNLVFLGSCFSQHIAQKCAYHKLSTLSNPLGILFQPTAIETVINNALNNKTYTDADVFLHQELWHCFSAHSICSNPLKEKVLATLNTQSQLLKASLEKASHVVITLGTAWVYKHITSGVLVANCHKVPQKNFEKQLLSVSQIQEALQAIIQGIRQKNPQVCFIFTISPVRHIKDGMVENTRSKSHLIAALHEVIAQQPDCFYFPSYEIVLDELREYRFYKQDMLHPNAVAIDYIWEKFIEAWLCPKALPILKRVAGVQKALAHRVFYPQTKAHQQFLVALERKKKALMQEFSWMQF